MGPAAASPFYVALMVMPILVLATLGWIGKTRDLRVPPALDAWLTSGWAPIVAGAVSALLTWWVWGSMTEGGIVHDERAYLLQARIFALWRWTGEPPPIATFFEQMHVFIDPRLAAKYPPGHALLLVPGVWLGLPGLVPVLLSGLSGALIFILARRVAAPVPAVAAWTLWATSFASLQWRASYFSQTTAGALWLLSLWALLQWRAQRRWFHLAIVITTIAWMYITRPLTAVALGLPIGLVILWDLRRHAGRWQPLAAALVLAFPIVLLNFVWQERTSGNWLTNPYPEYSRIYFPFDRPGFGYDASPPPREVPEELASVGRQFIAIHKAHEPLALPVILGQRTLSVVAALGLPSSVFLVPLFLSGAPRVRGPLLFGMASMASLFAAYLVFAHPPDWTLYYFEIFPVFFAVAAVEAVRLASNGFAIGVARAQALVVVAVAVLLPWRAADVWMARRENDSRSAFQRTAVGVLTTLPHEPAVVFVRYPETHNFHFSIITNTPDYRAAPLWLVYDRGERNGELLDMTTRPAYRLDVATWTLERLR